MRKCFNGIYMEITEEEIEEHLANIPVTPKAELIANSKIALAEYLETHPLTWTDGKEYSVTAEKQALLTSQLPLYMMAVQAGVEYELHWNVSGEECKVWTYEDLCALAMAVSNYVQPLVSIQQEYEVLVQNAESDREANAIQFKLYSV